MSPKIKTPKINRSDQIKEPMTQSTIVKSTPKTTTPKTRVTSVKNSTPAFPLLKTETRSWAELDRFAKLSGFSLQERIEAMGGPKS